ncbi:MAG: hypothetical protein U5L96_04590 [Owenweeksia sp.]|nr:hypothetical protein [Owenweeksia sp.]
MLQDKVNGQLYILYENRGRIQLQPIDDTKESYNIDEFPFPTKLQIHRGQVYFTSNPAMDGSNFLFRMNQ